MGRPEAEVGLRPFAPRDVRYLVRWTPTPRALMQWAGTSLVHPLTAGQFQELFEQDERHPSGMAWQIVVAGEREPCGHVELLRIDRARGTAHLARLLIGPPERRGIGLGGAAIRSVLGVASDLGLTQVTLTVFARNVAAIRCYAREGFQLAARAGDAAGPREEPWQSIAMARRL